MLIQSGVLDRSNKRSLYGKVKSGIFRNKRVMLIYLKENGLIPEDYEPPKPEPREKKPKPVKEQAKKEGESA